jgi:hypothetical protein
MTRRGIWASVFLGLLIIGPTASYAAAIIRFGIGITSSFSLTRYAGLTLGIGSAVAVLAAACCAAAKWETRRCGWYAAATALAVYVVPLVLVLRRPSTPPAMLLTAALEALSLAASAGITALLMGVAAKRWT